MNRFTSILMPYDGSNMSGEALETAKMIAKNQNATLTVLYVHDVSTEGTMLPMISTSGDAYLLQSQMNMETAPLPMSIPEALTESEKNRIESDIPGSIIAGAKSRMSTDIKVTYEVVNGNPAKEIIHYAEEKGADLIVMGGRGLSGIRKYTMGSVSHKVSNHVACSIMIIR